MDFKIAPGSPDRIETADHTFKITTNTDQTDLALSISAIGLLQPPVLIHRGGTDTVVCGFRRIAACKALNIASIPTRILPPDTSDIVCAQIAISDNSFQRSLNIVEQSRAYALVRRFAGRSPTCSKIVQSTGLACSQTAMDRILPVAGMPLSMQDAILDGSIALPIALQINLLDKNDALALGCFFRQISTGLNIQRELLALITEISHRDDIPVFRLMEQIDIAAVVGNADLPAPQKVRRLRMLLKVKRYPEVSKAESLYNQEVKLLKLNPRVQLQPPRFFEGNTYRLTLTLDSRRQLKSLLRELEKLVEHPNLLPE